MKTILFLLLFSFSLHAFGQDANQYSFIKDSLLQKNKNQKTTAWVMLGGGAALAIGGAAIATVEATNAVVEVFDNGSSSTSAIGPVLTIVGVGCMAGSIPFFIASGKNRQKGMQISTIAQEIKIPVPGGFACRYQPAISIEFVLGRR